MSYSDEERNEIINDFIEDSDAADDRLFMEKICPKCIKKLEILRKEQKLEHISWVRWDPDDVCKVCYKVLGEIIEESLSRENPLDFLDETDDDFSVI